MVNKKKMVAIGGSLIGLAGMTVAFFKSSNSKTDREFADLAEDLMKETEAMKSRFTEDDIIGLPGPVRRHLQHCGFIGKSKMAYMKAFFPAVTFSLGRGKPAIRMAYTQYNFVAEPARIAYIDSTLYGMPFEGIDAYFDGKGSMKGVLGKVFTLFNLTGEAMDKASLVTFLSECLFVPTVAIQDYVHWEAIDAHHAKASITAYGISASGIFAFNEEDEMISFTTDDREATAMDGTSEKVSWSAICREYVEKNGIRQPTALQAIWHYTEGDLIYFDAKAVEMTYDKFN